MYMNFLCKWKNNLIYLKLWFAIAMSKKTIIFISRYATRLYRWRNCILELWTFNYSRYTFAENTKYEKYEAEKCKGCKVHRATYSRSIKKFSRQKFFLQTHEGARVRILHRFPELIYCKCRQQRFWSVAIVQSALSTLTDEGLHGIEFNRGKKKSERPKSSEFVVNPVVSLRYKLFHSAIRIVYVLRVAC